ncbi:HpcH/HpaI aldolase family protein [Tropicibacter oceani]|uniref:Aldolase/citrate lyase family protein n=1 Tax=Tropicibacter oceani TaxID=3058420 RepID=A0ABY8QL66_9RHOB|nr:aldolase/citrate lyase family protein [Tropicibacter oceani]WGW04746.1 aldolase/citrate lyase family protein [Tropicibacter oceani]
MAELKTNTFKAAIQRMELQRGLWCTMSDPLAAEMMADCGFDWMMFDTEHSPMDPVSLLPLLQAVAPYPVTSIVRPSCLNAAEIKKLLDIGAQTILVPYVQTADEAAQAVAAVTYPPAGIRGVAGLTRATQFGKIPGYHKRAREQICLIVQVETREAMGNIEAIAAVEGVDGIFVGPADLAASLGYPGEPNHPEVTRAVLDCIRRIRAAGVPPGILTLSQEVRLQAIEAGAVFVAGDLDLAALRKGLSTPD